MIKELNYIKVGAVVPTTQPADITQNTAKMIEQAKNGKVKYCDILLYPELSITAYSCADLFQQSTLLNDATTSLLYFCDATKSMKNLFVLGLPLAVNGCLYNCAVVVQKGKILAVVPKTYIPNHNEFYEARWFSSARNTNQQQVKIGGDSIPFGSNLIFEDENNANFTFAIEICEDLWATIPPSSYLALNGASIILNLSASNEIVGKAEYRKNLVVQQSAKTITGYVYASAGVGESTTDTVCGGHIIMAENGHLLVENRRFQRKNLIVSQDFDLEYIQHERINNITFSQAISQNNNRNNNFRRIPFVSSNYPQQKIERTIPTHPFVPSNNAKCHERCQEIFAIQSNGLATRLAHTGIQSVIIGLSGGMDSTLALLVAIQAFDILKLDKSKIYCLTMPGFGTTNRTKNNAVELCKALNINIETINISPACKQHFKDLKHDPSIHDITYENIQARERTQILMNKANQQSALVIGTGDLSELALGWCTYNGDHISMYAVNIGIPKTLVRFLIDYYANNLCQGDATVVLKDVLATPISPELLPPDQDGNISQKTEDLVGPYELHDFFIYQCLRCGFAPAKILCLAQYAFEDKYETQTIKKWLKKFYQRFFSQQFKRSCIPDGPKVGTIALSPRGDWRMPSDATAKQWLQQL